MTEVRAVHQFVPMLHPHDAVGGHTLNIQAALRELGLESEIFSEFLDPRIPGRARPYQEFLRERRRRRPGSEVLVYQLAIGSGLVDALLPRDEPLVVNYHNITPERFFESWEPDFHLPLISWGRAQLAALAGRSSLGVGVSSFNEAELREVGYRRTCVAPVLVDLAEFERDVDEAAMERLLRHKRGGGADWLFVGRIVPNKAQHDLVRAFALYRRLYDPRARLHLVGATAVREYGRAVHRYVRELGVAEAVSRPGSVSQGELAAYYRAADVFVCLSDHEGFGIPLLEAMHHGVPVLAYATTAVPETVDGAGVLLPDKRPATVAAAAHRIVTDTVLRDRLVAAGRRRLADFDLSLTRARFLEAIRPVLEEAAA